MLYKVPAHTIIPAFGIFYASFLSENQYFSNDYIEWGISPKNFNFVNKKRFSELKDIKSNFYETHDLSKTAFQIIIDENSVNAFIHTLTSDGKSYSFRDVLSMFPNIGIAK